MPQKKQSPFMIFVMEWKNKNAPKMDIKKAIEKAGVVWDAMTNDKKQYYKDKAKEGPKQPGKKAVKLTSDGTPIEHIEKREREKQLQKEQMITNIQKTIATAINNNRLKDEKFYFLMFNHFVRIIHTENYVPAEIAIVEFSFKDGITRKFHSYVNPNVDFYGHLYEAKAHADNTHRLPLPPDVLPCKESEDIFLDVLKFIYNVERDAYPPLYTHEKYIDVVNSCLEFLMGENEESKSNLDVYSVQHLLHKMEIANQAQEKPNFYLCCSYIDSEFEFTKDIACDFHEENERSHHCALANVTRWAFTFADRIGKNLCLNFIPGRHMPGTYNAGIIMSSSSQNNTQSESVQNVTDGVSNLSVSSNYDTCDDELMSARSHGSFMRPTSRAPVCNVTMPECTNSTQNPWRRHDTSQPPDSHHFLIDESENQRPAAARGSRPIGRGVAILDDDLFPSLVRGRGRSKAL